MSPQEKAEELVDKYYVTIVSFLNDRMKNTNAKQCALIAVNEILQAIGYCEDPESNYNVDCYWADVKQEINKL